MLRDKVGLAVLEVLLCTMGSIAFGFAYFGHQVFNPELTYFQFVFFGLIAGVFVAASPVWKSRWLLLVGVLTFLGLLLSTKSNTPMLLIKDAVGVLFVFAAVRLGVWGNRFLPSWPIGKFVVWGAIFAVTHVCAFLLLVLIKTQSIEANPEFVVVMARIGALLGAGVGFGYEIARIVASRVWYSKEGAEAARRSG